MIKELKPTRAEGLERLKEFAPRACKPYTEQHAFDFGPARRDNVSQLSPYLRYRLISDSEVAEAVLAANKPAEVETFLGQLSWRSYWRGWLESHPQVYLAYRRLLDDDQRRFAGTLKLAQALEGRTGIEAFDAWNQELIETGYLHHHARLWYASIWIFTLRLPWTLGAAHFQKYLVDGDAACNTLAWRWVGGLHTPGKHFLARAEDIARFTDGRFNPKGQLNESAVSLTGPPLPPARLMQLPQVPTSLLGDRYALLLTPDDLSPETTPISDLKPEVILYTGLEQVHSSYTFSDQVRAFVLGGVQDALARLSAAYGCPVEPLPPGSKPGARLGERLSGAGIPHLVYYQPAVGPWQELLSDMTALDVGLRYFPLRRHWDAALFPHSEKGYFQYQKSVLPLVMKNKGKL